MGFARTGDGHARRQGSRLRISRLVTLQGESRARTGQGSLFEVRHLTSLTGHAPLTLVDRGLLDLAVFTPAEQADPGQRRSRDLAGHATGHRDCGTHDAAGWTATG